MGGRAKWWVMAAVLAAAMRAGCSSEQKRGARRGSAYPKEKRWFSRGPSVPLLPLTSTP